MLTTVIRFIVKYPKLLERLTWGLQIISGLVMVGFFIYQEWLWSLLFLVISFGLVVLRFTYRGINIEDLRRRLERDPTKGMTRRARRKFYRKMGVKKLKIHGSLQ